MTKEEYETYRDNGNKCIVCQKVMFGESKEISLLSIGVGSGAASNTYYLYFHTTCLRQVAGDQYVVE